MQVMHTLREADDGCFGTPFAAKKRPGFVKQENH
jgi:hypothetical protein